MVRTIAAHSDAVTSLAFDSNNLLASGSKDETIKLWNITNGNEIREPSKHDGWVMTVAFDKNNILAACSYGNTIKLWDVNKGTFVRDIYHGHSSYVNSVAFDDIVSF